MGVRGLWKVLEPTARPVLLESLRGKILAIDASIWIYHFLKAMRDPTGTIMRAAHIIGFFRRICKLLFYEIKPVFVFDGAAPILKKITTTRRQERRQNREQSARATANKLLTLQLQRRKQELAERDQRTRGDVQISGEIPENATYHMEPGAATISNPGPSNATFQQTDQYHLPEIDKIAPLRLDDQRMLTEEELDEYSRKFTEQARAGFIDTSAVDFNSPNFAKLPMATQYQLLASARLKSRLRMGYTADELDRMFRSRMDFSRFQIDRVAQRNFFTQRILNLVGLEDDLTRRVAGEKNKEYMLKRNDQGWTLSLEDKKQPQQQEEHNAKTVKQEHDSESSEEELEDVDIDVADQPDAKPEEELPQAIPVSKEQEADLDALFGYEAGLQRRDLYDILAEEPEHDVEVQPGTSLLFSSTNEISSESAVASRPYTAEHPTPESSRQAFDFAEKAKDSNDVGAGSQLSATQPDADTMPPPWFRTQNDFVEMRARDDTAPGLMSYEEAQKLAEEYPSESESEQGSNEDISIREVRQLKPSTEIVEDHQRLVLEKSAPRQGSVLTEERDSTAFPDSNAEIRIPGGQSREYRNDTVVELGSKPDYQDESIEESDKVPLTLSKPGHPAAEGLRTGADQGLQEPQENLMTESNLRPEPDLGENQYQKPELDPQEKPVLERKQEKELLEKHELELEKELNQKQEQELQRKVELESEPEPLGERDQELANEDERADQEEDQDIAELLIGEAEENERFQRELAQQNWTDADAEEYEQQVKHLRGQFAKQSRDSDTVTSDMIQDCQELLQLFGVPYVTAPMEAEAQCAELLSLGLVDGIVTDDGDAFLFGNVTVYRNMFSQAKYVECYQSQNISQELGLDRHGLVELALLLGSDYTDGLAGIGPVTGVEILAEFGNLEAFKSWWEQAQRFPETVDTSTKLKRRLLKQFASKLFISDEFPNSTVEEAYFKPVVDSDATAFNWGSPNPEGLRQFLAITCGWAPSKTNEVLLPVVQEAKRRSLLDKSTKNQSQTSLDDYYTTVRELNLGSKRAAQATAELRRQKHPRKN